MTNARHICTWLPVSEAHACIARPLAPSANYHAAGARGAFLGPSREPIRERHEVDAREANSTRTYNQTRLDLT